jgi:hypothetical protein
VPASSNPVRVRDVRVASYTPGGVIGNLAGGPIEESDVNGLVADLGVRPVKGPGYAPNRVAVVNESGALESATGDPAECVRVDGSSGPCGSSGPVSVSFVDGDTLTGIVDGANTLFSLTSTPSPAASLALYRNGLLQKSGLDYSASGQTVQFAAEATPQPGDTLLASYRSAGTGGGTPQVLCAANGGATTATELTSLGTCEIAAGTLAAGDRVEIRLDWAHQGAISGFTIALKWGATTVIQRDGNATDTLVSVRADAGLHPSGAQWSLQSWGSSLAFSAGVSEAGDDYAGALTIDVLGSLTSTGDTLALRNFTVVRVP